MKRIILLILLAVLILLSLFFLRSCGYLGTTSPPDVPKLDLSLHPSEPLKSTPHDLCPPDGAATEKPVFTAIEVQPDGKLSTLGNFSNSKGQIFILKVIGSKEAAMTKYINEVMVCGDILPLAENIAPKKFALENQVKKLRDDILSLHSDNLIIAMDIVGQARGLSQDEIIEYLKKEPIREAIQEPILFSNGEAGSILPASTLYRRPNRDFAFDFIIDPTISSGVYHDYQPVRSTNAQAGVTTSIRYDGYGSVTSTLYYGGWWVGQSSIHGGNLEGTLSYANYASENYDFLVQGREWGGSRYRVSGSLWHNYSPYFEFQ